MSKRGKIDFLDSKFVRHIPAAAMVALALVSMEIKVHE